MFCLLVLYVFKAKSFEFKLFAFTIYQKFFVFGGVNLNARIGMVLGFLIFVCASVFAAPWDILRGPAFGIELIDPVVAWLVFFVSFAILVVALLALKKRKSSTLMWVGAALGLFFIKRLLIVVDLYLSPGEFMNTSIQGFFDLLIMISFFIALFRK